MWRSKTMCKNILQLAWLLLLVSSSVVGSKLLPQSQTSLLGDCGVAKTSVSTPAFLPRPRRVESNGVWDRLRGGSDDEEEEEDDESEEEGVMDKVISVTQTTILPYTKKAVLVLAKYTKKVSIATVKAIQRAIQAGMQGETADEDEEEGSVSIVEKVVATIQRMVKAAFTFPDEEESEASDDNDEEDETPAAEEDDAAVSAPDEETPAEVAVEKPAKKKSKKSKSATTPAKPSDFGAYLASAYGIQDKRGDSGGAVVLGGSFLTAMQEARAQARLLVVFLPAEKPSKKSAGSKEAIAIESILSEEVGEAANKKARSKGEDTGSFLVWSAKVGSSEATAAIKALKVKQQSGKGGKKPTLVIVYPAMAIDSATGQPKLVAKIVGQHHCNPPPDSTSMATWLEMLRKRHAKHYVAMQKVVKELQYLKERKEGYAESQKTDKERQKQEKEEEEKRLAAEKAEEERLEALETRRKELKENLPEEAKGNDAKKIALRFTDGRSGQRRFEPTQSLADVFNWVDAMFEIEREKVVLTTMNGKQTLTWDDNEKNLEEAGVTRTTGFRVSVKETEEKGDE